MIPESMAVVRGKVISAAPLKIQVINDDKLILTENIICLPAHLQEYTTKCDILLSNGTIDSQTYNDGEHSQPDAGYGGAHVNHLQTFNIWNAVIKVHNALKVGEVVYILSFNQGKKYYILDREEKTS
jgi:hypothetical protein